MHLTPCSRTRRFDRCEWLGEIGDPTGLEERTGRIRPHRLCLLLDLLRPTRGGAQVLGLDTRRDGRELRRQVGYVPGELALYPRLTGEENLRFFAALRGGVDWTWVHELARRFDADLSRRVGGLSTGNKRKLALIQAFMHRPPLLILDEPTAGLDPLMQHAFYALLRESREAGQTVLLSSHLLPEVQEVCGRAAFVRAGRLIAVEDMSALGTRAVHEVEVVLARDQGGAAAEALAALPGVSGVSPVAGTVRCRVAGSMDPVVKLLARFDVTALRSSEPDLEDLFMAYYGEEQRGETADAE